MNLQGKTALITGASKRIGRAIALSLASRGVRVLIHYFRSRQNALALQQEIRKSGGSAEIVRLNFPARGPAVPLVKKFVASLIRRYSHIDILVNNAAIFYPTPLGKIREEDWDAFLTVNLKVPFFLAQEIGAGMLTRKCGKIINLADWTGERPYARYLPYCISKGALITATKGLAKALAPYVQVNAVLPGPVLKAKGMTRAAQKAVLARSLLKRFGDPRDVAAAVLFLCEGSDFVTGSVIPVEGGSLAA